MLIVALLVLVVVYLGGYGFAGSRRYPIEIREVTPTGAVTFTQQNYDDWNHEQISSATWLRAGLLVRHVIYSQGLIFAFTTSGRVLGLRGGENNGPCYCEESFWWTGDPHDFQFPPRWYGAS